MGKSTLTTIADRIQAIQQQLPPTVRLIAVTKTVSVAAMRIAYAHGIRDFAESRVQEALEKQAALSDLPDLTWHLIGHLQSNKAQRALQLFTWIQSVDSLKLAQRLDRLAAEQDCSPQICLQVKPLPDPAKYGWAIADLRAELPALVTCTHLQLRGLMTILPQGLSPAAIAQGFQQVAAFAAEIQQTYPQLTFDQVSMGMSHDYPLAIQAGATMIRPGRILFGDRA